MSSKKRIDLLLVENGLVESRNKAQRLIMAGEVRVDGQLIHKASQMIQPNADIVVVAGPRYVSRGGEKLAGALADLGVDAAGKICADVGASTGGFTDCLLQHDAVKVYAIDVGKGIVHWRLRNDSRVILLEGTNARYLEELPERVEIVTVDASFISLKLLLGPISNWLTPDGEIICLIKPQFEAGRDLVKRGGVVKDAEVHRQVIRSIAEYASSIGLHHVGLARSALKGPKGNVEFFLWCVREGESVPIEDLIGPIFPEEAGLNE